MFITIPAMKKSCVQTTFSIEHLESKVLSQFTQHRDNTIDSTWHDTCIYEISFYLSTMKSGDTDGENNAGILFYKITKGTVNFVYSVSSVNQEVKYLLVNLLLGKQSATVILSIECTITILVKSRRVRNCQDDLLNLVKELLTWDTLNIMA